jgi:2-(1,2-epoxy-1,2-dihydrophenyl)acetyl-CoA isomerase
MNDGTGSDRPALEVRDEGRLRILRLNRPAQKNALNGELFAAIPRELRAAAADDGVWAIAVTAAGSAFCAGLDLASHGKEVQDAKGPGGSQVEDERARTDSHWSVIMRVECAKPIIAGIQGPAVGAGVSLAMNADVRIAGPSARFHPGYARVGTSPDFGLTWTLVRAVGYERAIRFLLDSRMVPAAELFAQGFVSEVVDSDEALEARVLEYGGFLASLAPIAVRNTKRLLVQMDLPPDLPGHLDSEIDLALQGLGSADGGPCSPASRPGSPAAEQRRPVNRVHDAWASSARCACSNAKPS